MKDAFIGAGVEAGGGGAGRGDVAGDASTPG